MWFSKTKFINMTTHGAVKKRHFTRNYKISQAQKIMADALHLHPSMTRTVHEAGGVFILRLKDNQKELAQDMKDHAAAFAPAKEQKAMEKGHGRLETKQYSCFDVSGEYFDSRWGKPGFNTLFRVERARTVLKTSKTSQETSYYISNEKALCMVEHYRYR